MEYIYWKKFDNNDYSFEDALRILRKNNQIQMRIKQIDSYKEIRIDKDNLPNNIDDIELPLWAIKKNNWNLYIPDYEMEDIVNDLRYYLDSVYEVDSRFYDINKMDINDIFNQLDDYVFNEKLRMEIILWLRDNKKIKKRY